MDRIQGVIAQAVYMDPGVKHNVERTRALGEVMLSCIFPFSPWNLRVYFEECFNIHNERNSFDKWKSEFFS